MNHLSELLDRWFLFFARILCLNFLKKTSHAVSGKEKTKKIKLFLTLRKQK